MTVYGYYDVIAFKSCIQIFTVHLIINFKSSHWNYQKLIMIDFLTKFQPESLKNKMERNGME